MFKEKVSREAYRWLAEFWNASEGYYYWRKFSPTNAAKCSRRMEDALDKIKDLGELRVPPLPKLHQVTVEMPQKASLVISPVKEKEMAEYKVACNSKAAQVVLPILLARGIQFSAKNQGDCCSVSFEHEQDRFTCLSLIAGVKTHTEPHGSVNA